MMYIIVHSKRGNERVQDERMYVKKGLKLSISLIDTCLNTILSYTYVSTSTTYQVRRPIDPGVFTEH
jgi:hypothetical protein